MLGSVTRHGLIETSLIWLENEECVVGGPGNVGKGKLMQCIFYQAKDFKTERDIIKYVYSGSNCGSK